MILGATKLAQLKDNLGALDFEIPAELRARLDSVSKPVAPFPYSLFRRSRSRRGITGGLAIGDKPVGYMPTF